ncbi:META domain-containing protein [Tessaracoccus sp. MC1679]|uniref:META domain-containing protein n=1 Tax=Tessaracoccus sp. MC1679 TaxID=2760313 RepID=UPI0016013F72|nr:META domain-containing protein [Tessaracoccus sp. MC1679]MBB1516799.1 META domain-containing protein [Tessaracoccus sp. MC1679]
MAKALWTTAVVAMSLLLASCASATPAAPPSSGDLVGVTWLLEDLAGEAPVDGSPVTVHFADDGALFGSGGCNRFSGTYEIDGGTLTVGDALPSTMMACADDVMALESSFFTALTDARGFAVDGETLTLNDEGGEALGTFAAQSQELADTTWAITSYNDGSAAVSPLADTETELTFADDGTLSGTGGCNRLLGSYTAGDGEISFGTIATTQMACMTPEGLMDQEAAIVAALESAATYSIEGDMLEMRTADDAIAVQLTRA